MTIYIKPLCTAARYETSWKPFEGAVAVNITIPEWVWEEHIREVFNVAKELVELRQHRDRLLVANNEEVEKRRAAESHNGELFKMSVEKIDRLCGHVNQLIKERDAEIEKQGASRAADERRGAHRILDEITSRRFAELAGDAVRWEVEELRKEVEGWGK